MTWTGAAGGNDRPRSDNPDPQPRKPSLSSADITSLSCFGQQWIAVKVIDDRGNELLVVKNLSEAEKVGAEA